MLNLGPLEQKPVLFITELSLQPTVVLLLLFLVMVNNAVNLMESVRIFPGKINQEKTFDPELIRHPSGRHRSKDTQVKSNFFCLSLPSCLYLCLHSLMVTVFVSAVPLLRPLLMCQTVSLLAFSVDHTLGTLQHSCWPSMQD